MCFIIYHEFRTSRRPTDADGRADVSIMDDSVSRVAAAGRRDDLERALAETGLALRPDSRLCSCFINGQTGPEWDVSRVVHECSVMHWLYNFTDYPGECERAVLHESRCRVFSSTSDLMSYARRHVHPLVKEAVIRNNGGLPEVWPWLRPHDDAPPTCRT